MKSFFQRNAHLIFLIILCTPLLWLNVKDSHDWGDDFAQYLIQARNIIEHRPQTDNGLVFDQQAGEYALKAYPVGLPLMLAAVWKQTGYSIHSFLMLEAAFAFGFSILIFVFLKRFFSPGLSLAFALIAISNFIFLDFKKEILADIPFSFFFILSILLFIKQSKSSKSSLGYAIITGIIFGWTLSIKGIGIVLFAALIIEWLKEIFQFRKTGNKNFNFFSSTAVVFFSGLSTYFLLNTILFPTASGSFFNFYQRAFNEYNTLEMFKANVLYYYEVLKYFFNQGNGFWYQVSNITKYIMVYGFLAGIIISWKKKFNFDDLVFILYFILLLLYPYQSGGFRFWIPIVPFLLKYIGVTIMALLELTRIPFYEKIATVFIMLIVFENTNGVAYAFETQSQLEDGPQKTSASTMLEYIKSNIPKDGVIAFKKPRALSFYTDRKTTFALRQLNAEQNYQAMQRMNAHYFLRSNSSQLHDEALQKVIDTNKDKLKIAWQNEEFIIYTDKQ